MTAVQAAAAASELIKNGWVCTTVWRHPNKTGPFTTEEAWDEHQRIQFPKWTVVYKGNRYIPVRINGPKEYVVFEDKPTTHRLPAFPNVFITCDRSEAVVALAKILRDQTVAAKGYGVRIFWCPGIGGPETWKWESYHNDHYSNCGVCNTEDEARKKAAEHLLNQVFLN